MIRIRAFRAIDEPETCEQFIEGHVRVLKAFNITMITSAKAEWTEDPNTYVIVAESTDTGKVLGGARVQVAGGKLPLPIETAVEKFDKSIYSVIKDYSKEGTAELCGLWNSREIAGMGIGSTFLIRTAVCITIQLNLKTLFALCAPYIVEIALKTGFHIATFLGNEGTFYYPKEDLIATAAVIPDITTLDSADIIEKSEIFSLRENLKQTRLEEGRRKSFYLDYDLKL
ncbi:hypothetical protein [Mucilaginibacter arboris]|uniref:N-acetyltransferase domain-containing protein n=1 Tax=Mucilaginibacter arboris TaxID=2682090 RepID=A0A7K1SVZ8_9SPHI|nr:hypothetical protein [Mucilaginibacter arboris]MVN21240.1 hypothetical protein [Mucilaginibacter arboris]